MYAIVEIAGQQFKVEKDQKVFVHRLEANEGDQVSFADVLLLDQDGKVTVGTPVVSGAGIKAEVLRHLKGDKVIVFKKKRRKGYQKANGHRQYFTEILVKDVVASGFEEKKETKKKEALKPKAEPKAKAEPKKAEPKAKATAAPVTEAPKKEVKKAAKKVSKGDDLKKIEGIGPKIAEILTTNGIATFAQLAKTDAEKIKEILLAQGKRYAMHNPTTWPKQAELAAEGKWDELKKWQDELDGGK
jgi:large subunit ribosomal protein L21